MNEESKSPFVQLSLTWDQWLGHCIIKTLSLRQCIDTVCTAMDYCCSVMYINKIYVLFYLCLYLNIAAETKNDTCHNSVIGFECLQWLFHRQVIICLILDTLGAHGGADLNRQK